MKPGKKSVDRGPVGTPSSVELKRFWKYYYSSRDIERGACRTHPNQVFGYPPVPNSRVQVKPEPDTGLFCQSGSGPTGTLILVSRGTHVMY